MISVSSYAALSPMTLEEAFKLVSRDFDGWEIVGEGVHTITDILPELERLIPSYDLQLSIHAPFSDVNIGSFNLRIREEAVRQVIEAIHIADGVGMRTATVHPGFFSPLSFSSPKKVLDITRESIRLIDSSIQGLGIRVGVENMPDMVVTTCHKVQDLLYVIEGTDIGICFDVGHANTTGETENFLQCSDRFVNVHLHDNDGRSDPHMPMGAGTVDYESIIGKLSDYTGTFVLESRSYHDALAGKAFLKKLLSI
ncbi:MAG: sugar phosphate isomerase/epimerase family protein [Thermoplasmata archaeon]